MKDELLALIDLEKLPFTLKDIVDCIGRHDAYQLSLYFGGRPLYIPKYPGRSALIKLLGEEALKKLSHRFSGTTLEIPKHDHFDRQLRDIAILRDSKQGISRKDLAKKYNLCLRHIGNIKKNMQINS